VSEGLERLAKDLQGTIENLVLLDAVDSTHAMAGRLIASMAEEEQPLGTTLILAARQLAGEGRGDRKWESPKGGLFLSWLASGIDSETTARLPLLAAVAAHAAITEIGVAGARIKWPNDILVEGRKLAGIIISARHGEPTWVTVGLGVNVHGAPVLDDTEATQPTSVSEHLEVGDADTWRVELARSFVRNLSAFIRDPMPAIEAWRTHLVQVPGEALQVRLASGEVVDGTLTEITPEGYLRVVKGDTERVITSGDIVER
jgi:BirA family biotin operon repressor/biotin-[acetyl-CoA-carboxylase] ligase